MIVTMISLAPNSARRCRQARQAAPLRQTRPRKSARAPTNRGRQKEATARRAKAPQINWPSPPILKRPALSAMAVPRPRSVKGIACTSTSGRSDEPGRITDKDHDDSPGADPAIKAKPAIHGEGAGEDQPPFRNNRARRIMVPSSRCRPPGAAWFGDLDRPRPSARHDHDAVG